MHSSLSTEYVNSQETIAGFEGDFLQQDGEKKEHAIKSDELASFLYHLYRKRKLQKYKK